MNTNSSSKAITFDDLEKQIYSLVCNLGCDIMKQILENQDNQIMLERDKSKYRHKGYRKNCIKTLMGEIDYNRAIYLYNNNTEKKHVYLLDEYIKLECFGKISSNLAEKMLNTVINTVSYRKGAKEINKLTNETISHEGLKNLVWKIGKQLEEKEKEQIELLKEEKLLKGTREIQALFEEADGIWINLQGKDRQEQLEKYKIKCEKKQQEFNPKRKMKSELKLHVMHEGWKKDDKRHPLINKTYIAGMMSSKQLEKIRNAKVYQKYNEDEIKLRVMNGDGARWIKNITTKDTISQKDKFHIHQEIIRDIREKEHQEILLKMFEEKRYNEIPLYIEHLKYECGGEEKTIKKLEKLKSYLKNGLPRYQDILRAQERELPKAPENIEYRDMGVMESQIFSVLKVRLVSGRKAFSKRGANYLSKICAIYAESKGNILIEKISKEIEVDNSVEEWIKAIEENVRKNKKMHRADRKETEEYNYAQGKVIEFAPELKQILKLAEPTALMYR